tara:strand:- start:370 stop:1272 length:903 start_codon:yes stop_codon:yes gene_type:complete
MFCIALKGSARRADVETELSKHGLQDVKILEFERDTENGMRGCFHSHQHCLRQGVESGADTIVVFEDDVLFKDRGQESIVDTVARARMLVSKNPSLIVGLGGLVIGPVATRNPIDDTQFYMCRWACAHAYVVSRQMASVIMDWKFEDEHYDVVMYRAAEQRMAICLPTVAFQRPYFVQITTTDSSLGYKLLTFGRNMISPVFVQIVFEHFWWILSICARALSCEGWMSRGHRNAAADADSKRPCQLVHTASEHGDARAPLSGLQSATGLAFLYASLSQHLRGRRRERRGGPGGASARDSD